jgi:hypothetical protein
VSFILGTYFILVMYTNNTIIICLISNRYLFIIMLTFIQKFIAVCRLISVVTLFFKTSKVISFSRYLLFMKFNIKHLWGTWILKNFAKVTFCASKCKMSVKRWKYLTFCHNCVQFYILPKKKSVIHLPNTSIV